MRFIFAGGGTGGHLFPGIALAQKAAQRYPEIQVRFYCTSREFDAVQLRKYSLPHRIMPAPRLTFRPALPLAWTRAVAHAACRLREDRPDAVLGLGGYGSLPSLAAARLAGIPCAVLEQNVLPGKVNRLAALWAFRIYSQWDEAKKFFSGASGKFRHTGSPLRESITILNREEARKSLGLEPARTTLAVLGGSQGAQAINVFMVREARLLGAVRDRIQIVHLAGAKDTPDVARGYREAGISARVIEFTDRMDSVFSASDLVLSRAGGMAISEIAFYGLPAVLIPYPFAAEDHQMRNARVLERAGAAQVIPESCLTEGIVRTALERFLTGRDEFLEQGRRIRQFARPDASDVILNDLMNHG